MVGWFPRSFCLRGMSANLYFYFLFFSCRVAWRCRSLSNSQTLHSLSKTPMGSRTPDSPHAYFPFPRIHHNVPPCSRPPAAFSTCPRPRHDMNTTRATYRQAQGSGARWVAGAGAGRRCVRREPRPPRRGCRQCGSRDQQPVHAGPGGAADDGRRGIVPRHGYRTGVAPPDERNFTTGGGGGYDIQHRRSTTGTAAATGTTTATGAATGATATGLQRTVAQRGVDVDGELPATAAVAPRVERVAYHGCRGRSYA